MTLNTIAETALDILYEPNKFETYTYIAAKKLRLLTLLGIF